MGPSGTTRVAAVIGHPVRHSLSPAIHNAAFRSLDLDWRYVAFDVAPGQAAAAVAAMRALHLGGLSVTMPHKADAVQAVDRTTSQAASLRAVNCIAWDKGELVGHNTDGAGFIASVSARTGKSVAGLSCVVVGAGGAARAVVLALAEAGAADVAVVNRTRSKAEAAVALAGGAGRVGRVHDVAASDLVVNATPIGMEGTRTAGALPLPTELLHDGLIVADLVYHPQQTPLLSAAAKIGAVCVGGVGMLVHQAGLAFELWTGAPAPLDVMRHAVSEAISS
jgi:shikimate dehydrogenase